jgi:hypothetical protein
MKITTRACKKNVPCPVAVAGSKSPHCAACASLPPRPAQPTRGRPPRPTPAGAIRMASPAPPSPAQLPAPPRRYVYMSSFFHMQRSSSFACYPHRCRQVILAPSRDPEWYFAAVGGYRFCNGKSIVSLGSVPVRCYGVINICTTNI